MPHTWVEWSCSQLLQNTPLHPIAEWSRQQFGGAETRGEIWPQYLRITSHEGFDPKTPGAIYCWRFDAECWVAVGAFTLFVGLVQELMILRLPSLLSIISHSESLYGRIYKDAKLWLSLHAGGEIKEQSWSLT